MNQELAALLPDALRDASSRVVLADGQVLFRRGEPVEFIYYVVQGELLALRYLPSGTEAVMQRAGAGEFFAQSAMGLSRYDCDARAKSATRAMRLPMRRLTEALATDGQFALTFAARLASDLRHQCARVERLQIKLVSDRILHFLACEGSMADKGLRLADLSEELGLDVATLSRAISKLRTAGEVVGKGRHIKLAPGFAAQESSGV